MNNIANEKNIKFMVFDDANTIETYVADKICDSINLNGGINLSIESRSEFLNILNKLKEKHKNRDISFRFSRFFMTDDFVYDRFDWESHKEFSSSAFLDDHFFKEVDFQQNNIHRIITNENYQYLFTDQFAVYDSKIDSKDGIDILVIKLHSDGSLIFNQKIDFNNLNTKGIEISSGLANSLLSEFSSLSKIPKHAATLGVDQIVKAKKIFLIGIGEDKKEVLNKLFFSKDYDKTTPLCFLKGHKDLTILCDFNASNVVINSANWDAVEISEETSNSEEITNENAPIEQEESIEVSNEYLENNYNNPEVFEDENGNSYIIDENGEYIPYDAQGYEEQQPEIFEDENGNSYIIDENGEYIPYDAQGYEEQQLEIFEDENGNSYIIDENGEYIPYDAQVGYEDMQLEIFQDENGNSYYIDENGEYIPVNQ